MSTGRNGVPALGAALIAWVKDNHPTGPGLMASRVPTDTDIATALGFTQQWIQQLGSGSKSVSVGAALRMLRTLHDDHGYPRARIIIDSPSGTVVILTAHPAESPRPAAPRLERVESMAAR